MIHEILFLIFVLLIIIAIIYSINVLTLNSHKGGYEMNLDEINYTGGTNDKCPTLKQNKKIIIDEITNKNTKIEYTDKLSGKTLYYNTKGYFLKDIHSDSQINTIIQHGSAGEFARLIQLLIKHLNVQGFQRQKILESFLRTTSDKEIYKRMMTHISFNEDDRSHYQADDVIVPILFENNIKNLENYLDIGGNNGKITVELKEKLNFKNAYVVEVNKNAKNSKINYEYVEDTENYKLSFKDRFFDFATAIMSLHHMKNLNVIIKELARVMKPGAKIFIKEHDCWNAFDAMLVDIEHAIFMHINKEDFNDYYIRYKNFYGWIKALSQYFNYEISNFYYSAVRHEISPTRGIWMILTKK